jgi:hypothetical protein
VTDAPRSDNITAILVTVSSIEVHRATAEQEQEQEQSGEEQTGQPEQEQEQDGEGEWMLIPLNGTKSFELLELNKQKLEELLGTADIENGKYTQIRMEVKSVEVSIEKGGITTTENATVPSGKIKFIHPFEIENGTTTILLLDFNAQKSVNVTGAGKIMFKPVIKLTATKVTQAVKITTESLPNGAINLIYNAALSANGGKKPYTWSVSGNIPAGLSVNATTGAITGTPTGDPGDYTFTIQVQDSSIQAKIDSKQFTIRIAAADVLIIITTSLPDAEADEEYTATVVAKGGSEPYVWSVMTGTLPEGLTLNAGTGVISGKPTTKGHYELKIKVTDSSSSVQSDNQSLSIDVI